MYFSILVICAIVYGRISTLELVNQTVFYMKVNKTKENLYLSNEVTFI
jgi:hypothetical protein